MTGEQRAVRLLAPGVVAEDLAGRGWDWLQVVAWDGEEGVPEDGLGAQVWVPPYVVAESRDTVQECLAALEQLEIVQLLTAGVEPWDALVPPRFRLCSGRGIHGGSTAELAVALVLASVRDLPRYVEQQGRRTW